MTPIKDKLYSNALERKKHEEKRLYIGFSEIGNECSRYLWLKFHNPELQSKPSPATLRIWDNGIVLENKIIHELRQANIEVSGQQIEMSLFNGKFKGHCDGIINHPEHGKVVLEIKGIQKNTWNQYVKKGVKELSPIYYAQAIMYSGYLDLTGTLFIIENKDDCDIYEEFIPSNKTEYTMLCRKAELIIYGTIPKGISSRPDWWKCVHCQFNHDEACRKNWEGESPF